ncbi:MAG: hypothetical protein LBT93_08800 [Treponema sp.]|nr:hypothetical protein [Treponema sp.]
MDSFIKTVGSICDYVRAKKRSKKEVYLSFDEWNVWFHSHEQDQGIPKWIEAPPRLEDIYTMEDALVVGCMLITLINNADRVKIACLAQLVNVIAPIMTEPGGRAWRQTIFHPFKDASVYGRGRVLRGAVSCESYDSREHAGVPYLETAAVHDEEGGKLTIFVVNRSLDQPMDLEADILGFNKYRFIEHTILDHRDLKAVNSAGEERVKPRQGDPAPLDGTRLEVRLPPASWNVIRLGI